MSFFRRKPESSERDLRLQQMVEAHFDLLWRTARRLGLDAGRAEDAAQKALIVAAEKLDSIECGKERAFLLGVVTRVSADARKSMFYRSAVFSSDLVEQAVDHQTGPESLLSQGELKMLLDRSIAGLAEDLRAVFVLAEIEGLSQPEIAEALALPLGTVASRLRRSKEQLRTQLHSWNDVRASLPNASSTLKVAI